MLGGDKDHVLSNIIIKFGCEDKYLLLTTSLVFWELFFHNINNIIIIWMYFIKMKKWDNINARQVLWKQNLSTRWRERLYWKHLTVSLISTMWSASYIFMSWIRELPMCYLFPLFCKIHSSYIFSVTGLIHKKTYLDSLKL